MKQTGQPLADAGRAIAAVLAKKESVEAVGTDELISAVRFLLTNINPNKKNRGPLNRLNILSMFWTNNPLMGKNPTVLPAYQAFIEKLLTTDVAPRPGNCQVCGKLGVYADSGRTWMPLSGSITKDPCSLPSLRGKFLCADCFRCVVLLPLGCRFCKAGPYLFHLTDAKLQVEATEYGVETIRAALLAKMSGSEGLKETTRLSGRLELLEIVTGSGLWDSSRGGKLSRRAGNGATIISFSNSGTSATWNQLHLPAQALDFFRDLTEAEGDLKRIFLGWAEKWAGDSPRSTVEALCDDIESRRSLAPIIATLVKRRKESEQRLSKEEKLVLKIYEETALGKGERFETLQTLASRVNAMEDRYRERFLKQLSNTHSKERFFELLRTFAKDEKTKEKMRFTQEDYRVLHEAPAAEAINLLYLLCVADGAQ